jgi:hypothetical protein
VAPLLLLLAQLLTMTHHQMHCHQRQLAALQALLSAAAAAA